MKRTLLSILCCLMAVTSYSQTNRYTTVSTSSYVPKSDQDIYNDLLVKQKNLNKNIFNLLDICENQLSNQEFCFGDFRNTVFSIKNRLNDVNKKAMNGFISIYDVENIYNSCARDYNRALKKHNRKIAKDKKSQKKLQKEEIHKSNLSFIEDIEKLELKVKAILKNKSSYKENFVESMSAISKEISMLKKMNLDNEFQLYTAKDKYKILSDKYIKEVNGNIYK